MQLEKSPISKLNYVLQLLYLVIAVTIKIITVRAFIGSLFIQAIRLLNSLSEKVLGNTC